MSEKISGKEHPLSKIFSSDFEYSIPPYQRPYAWKEEQTSELFDDLYDFHNSESEKSEDEKEGYFLGSIVLIKKEGNPRSEVVDGQQRLTTLTILLSALASKFEGDFRADLRKYIEEPGSEVERLERKPRLTLRDKDQDFFHQHIQSLQFTGLSDVIQKDLNESQLNLKKNAEYISDELENKFKDEKGNLDKQKLKDFSSFIMQHCYLVAVSTPSQKSAFRVFSVLNNRGLDLQATDIIKADTIGQLASEECVEYNGKWEAMEDMLGRDGFNDLFTYVRMIYAQDKPKRTLLEEFQKHVSDKVEPQSLVNNILKPYADTLSVVRTSNYKKATSHAKEINDNLKWLSQIDNADWTPVAMLFLKEYEKQPEYIDWFFNSLERLAAYMMVCGFNINERIKRYSKVIKTIEQLDNAHNPMESQALEQTIELTNEEKKEMLDCLDGNVYERNPKRRKYIILRLNSFVSDGPVSYDSEVLSIEHVLPQTVNGGQWAEWWSDEEAREKWLHRIGNLVLLNRRKNSQAQNYDFADKKEIYFVNENKVVTYALTTQVVSCEQWKEEDIEKRQAEHMKVFKKKWRL